MDEKVPLVLFSGGLDSTYLLYTLLQEGDVDVFRVESINLATDKQVAEGIAFNEVLGYFNEQFENKSIKGSIRFSKTIKISISGHSENIIDFGQMPIWLFAALHEVDEARHTSVNIGYVSGDQAASSTLALNYAWDWLRVACCPTRASVVLRFPLIHVDKETILKTLPTKLRDLVWFCDSPEKHITLNLYMSCGKCTPCIRMSKEVFGMELSWHKLDGFIPHTEDHLNHMLDTDRERIEKKMQSMIDKDEMTIV